MPAKKLLQVLYEDDYIIAIDKPPRLASVPAENIPLAETALGKLQSQFEARQARRPDGRLRQQSELQTSKPYILHRLDYQTSGILLFGKKPQHREILEKIFRDPETRKKYIALVLGIPRGNVIFKKLKARQTGLEVPAQTNFHILEIFHVVPPLSLVEAEIKTGRKHQIRRHFAHIKHPIMLDAEYGNQRLNRRFRLCFRLGRQFLHAASLDFYHPFLKKLMHISSPLPPDLQNILKKLQQLR